MSNSTLYKREIVVDNEEAIALGGVQIYIEITADRFSKESFLIAKRDNNTIRTYYRESYARGENELNSYNPGTQYSFMKLVIGCYIANTSYTYVGKIDWAYSRKYIANLPIITIGERDEGL